MTQVHMDYFSFDAYGPICSGPLTTHILMEGFSGMPTLQSLLTEQLILMRKQIYFANKAAILNNGRLNASPGGDNNFCLTQRASPRLPLHKVDIYGEAIFVCNPVKRLALNRKKLKRKRPLWQQRRD
jgi:hypothetical protein